MITIKIYQPGEPHWFGKESEIQTGEIRHWAGLKWPRGWDIRIKASAVGICTNEMALALWALFIRLPLPSIPITFGVLYVFMFILTMKKKKWNDALPSAERQQICMSKEYRCDDEHFPLVWDSGCLPVWTVNHGSYSSPLHFHACQFIQPFSI